MLLLLLPCGLAGQPVISEFMASNRATLADADGAYSDWIEIHNPTGTEIDLTGWYLTDAAGNRTKWQFPGVTMAPGAYLLVFASNKDRRDPAAQLHTNFALSNDGEYLGLIRPDGATVAFEYAPRFPAQTDDVSYGVLPLASGGVGTPLFMRVPTPGRENQPPDEAGPPAKVNFSHASGPFQAAFELLLTGAAAGQVIRYELSHPTVSAEAPAEPSATSPAYTAPLSISRSTLVRAAVFAADGSTRGDLASAYYVRVAAGAAAFASQLPVVVLDTLASGPLDKDAIDHPGWAYVYGARPAGAATFSGPPELVTPLTATVRGSSSSFFPKKGFNFKFTDADGRRQARPVLGLPAHDRWALVAPWGFDPAFINNALVYSLSNRLGRWAPRTRFVEVFLKVDGGAVEAADYAGIYVLTDRVEVGPERVAVAALDSKDDAEPAVTGGYILKLDAPDYDEFSWTTERGVPSLAETAVVLVAPKADDVTRAQRAFLIGYVQQMEDALFADRDAGFARRTYLDFIDRASWVDHHILNTLAANPDALERSAYFTKPRHGRLQAGPVWDFDRAFGSLHDGRAARWDVWSGEGGANVWETGWWGVLARDPEFLQEWVDRWQALRRTTLADGRLEELVRALTAEIGAAAAAREAARWPEKPRPHGSFAEAADHLQNWIVQRARWIDRQWVAPPTVSAEGGSLVFTPAPRSVLVYTTDGSDPRALNGGFAPNAIVAATPVALGSQLNLQVRGYREDLKGVFPGSPWSSAVGGAHTTPLWPAARLVNLSVRAEVGAGEQGVITGITIADTKAKRYLARAVGPGLAAFGAEGFLVDPELTIVSASGVELFRNRGWQEGPEAAALPDLSRAVGAFMLAAGSRDAAIVARLPAGSFSLHAASASDQLGASLVELYELDGNGRTVNLSTRTHLSRSSGALIGGFVVQGPAYQRVLIRAVGPTLADLGVGNALADPVLKLFAGSTEIAANDRWHAGPNPNALRSATTQTGAFHLAALSEDAALLITLAPRAYTLEVSGKGDAEGVVLLEIYAVP